MMDPTANPRLPTTAILTYLAFCFVLILQQVFWEAALSRNDIDLLNLFVPLLFGAANLLLAWKLVRNSPLAIWNPLFWLLLACTLYYALGQLVHVWGHPDSVARVNTSYFVDPVGLARTNFLNTIGVTIIVASYQATVTILKPRIPTIMPDNGSEEHEQRSTGEARSALILFLIIGLPIKYLLQLPYDLGLLTWVLPGSIKYLGTLSGLAIIPLCWLYRKRGGIYRVLFFALLASESLVGLVSLSKQRMIETILFVTLGDQIVKPGLKKLAVSGLLTIVAYVFVMNPFVTFARVAINRASATNLSQTIDLAEQFNKKRTTVQDPLFPNAQLWWTRLAYSNVELFAMREYDRGHPGTTFWLAPYTLIPRFIMPEKPGMTSGLAFTHLIEGSKTSTTFTGLGAMGEGYWNGGWLGVAVICTVIGVLLALFNRFAMHTIGARLFMFLPIPMAGIILGLRIDDWFVPTYLGMTAQLLLFYMAVKYAVRPLLIGSSTAAPRVLNDVTLSEKTPRQFPLVSG